MQMRENSFSFQALIFSHLQADTLGSPEQSCLVQMEQYLAKLGLEASRVPWSTPGEDGMSEM